MLTGMEVQSTSKNGLGSFSQRIASSKACRRTMASQCLSLDCVHRKWVDSQRRGESVQVSMDCARSFLRWTRGVAGTRAAKDTTENSFWTDQIHGSRGMWEIIFIRGIRQEVAEGAGADAPLRPCHWASALPQHESP